MTAFFCPICKGAIENPNDPELWHRVVGWERITGTRASGKTGGSDIVLREVRPVFAHPGCITLKRNGLLGQESLGV